MHKKILVQGETRIHVLLLGRPQKILKKSEAEEVTLMWQLVEPPYKLSHLIKLIKSVTSLVLKKIKKKSDYYSLRFSRKSADLKKEKSLL